MDELHTLLSARLTERGAIARLAEASGLHQYQISRLAGPHAPKPTPKTLERLAPALGVSYEDLLRMCGYLPGAATNKRLDPDLAQVNARWDDLPAGRREAILRLTYRNRLVIAAASAFALSSSLAASAS